MPITITLLYILAFRQGRPPGYDTDLFELWLKGPGFGPAEPIPFPSETNAFPDYV